MYRKSVLTRRLIIWRTLKLIFCQINGDLLSWLISVICKRFIYPLYLHGRDFIKLTLNLLYFLNGILYLLSIFIFRESKMRINLKLVSQRNRAWSDCMIDVQTGLALHWWQRLITLGSSKIRVNVVKTESFYFKDPCYIDAGANDTDVSVTF